MSTSGSTSPVGRMICSTTTPCESRSSKSPGVAERLIICGTSDMNSSNWSGRLSSADGRRKPYSTSVSLRARSPLYIPPICGMRHVRLVHHDEKVGREVVEQARRALAGAPSAERPRVVLDAGAGAHLEQHLDVEIGARLESLRLEQLPRPAQLGQPLGELRADGDDGPLDLGPLGHEVLGRIDGALLELGDRVAGERVDLADPLDLVAPELDADGLLVVGGEDLDRVAAHAERALLEGDVVPAVLDADQLAEDVVAPALLATPHGHHQLRGTRADRRGRRWRSRSRR